MTLPRHLRRGEETPEPKARYLWADPPIPPPCRLAEVDEVLADPRIDAVHLLTPVAYHARQSIALLDSGRHCACAVPMAMSLADVDAVRAAAHASGRVYMGFHIQNLDGFAHYWQGYPPMAYVTHALSPVLALLDTTVAGVHCEHAQPPGGHVAPIPVTGLLRH